MKSIRIEMLSGKIYYINNIGSYFEVSSGDCITWNFSSLIEALEFLKGR